jgi:predicted DCC family thiol-disulfide oxidoreductase YuxK
VSGEAPVGGRLTVLYDARCRVCTRIAGRLAGLDADRRLRLRPLQGARSDAWPSVRRLARERDLRRALHVIDETGAWVDGGEAMLRAFERVPVFRLLARLGRLPLVSAFVEPGYRWFARNRARFSWLAGSFGPAQRIGRGKPRRPHGGVEAGGGTDG